MPEKERKEEAKLRAEFVRMYGHSDEEAGSDSEAQSDDSAKQEPEGEDSEALDLYPSEKEELEREKKALAKQRAVDRKAAEKELTAVRDKYEQASSDTERDEDEVEALDVADEEKMKQDEAKYIRRGDSDDDEEEAKLHELKEAIDEADSHDRARMLAEREEERDREQAEEDENDSDE